MRKYDFFKYKKEVRQAMHREFIQLKTTIKIN